MIELILGAAPVVAAYGWRMSFDAGRAHQRRLSVLNPGEAILINHEAMRRSVLMTKPDFEKLGEAAHDAADSMYRFRAAYAFHVSDPLAAMKFTGVAT